MADLYPPPPPPPVGGPTPPRRPMKPHRGTTILVFGILGFFCCIIFAILAWIWGNEDLAEMDRGNMDPEGRSLTSAGRILGIVDVCLAIAGIIIYGLIFAIAGTAAFLPGR